MALFPIWGMINKDGPPALSANPDVMTRYVVHLGYLDSETHIRYAWEIFL